MEPLTIYYDGRCPLCQAEILMLRARNRRGLIRFVDVADPAFDEAAHRVSCAQALEAIHGRLGGGRLLTGVEVFAEAYRRADLRVLANLLSVRWLGPLWRLGYRLFARYRYAISRAFGPALLRIASRRFPQPEGADCAARLQRGPRP